MAQRHPYGDHFRQPHPSMAGAGYGRGAPRGYNFHPHEHRMPFRHYHPGPPHHGKPQRNMNPTQAAGSSKSHHQQQRHHLSNDALENYSEQLQSIWLDDRILDKKAKGEAIRKQLITVLKESPNPWETALYLITNVSDYPQAKTVTLSFCILIEFQKWVGSPDNYLQGHEEDMLSEDLRTRVFYATTGKHLPYFNAAVKAFILNHPGNEYFVPITKAMLARSKLTETAQVVSRLGLQSHFTQDEILVPLLLTDKVNVIESYVVGNPEQQAVILSLLDHLCARNTDVLQFAQSSGLKNIKGEKLSKKVLSKFAMRLMKLYDIPPEACPNISENRAMGAIRYLLYKRYVEKSIGYGGWDDMVESAVGKNDNLKQQLIMELLGYNDMSEAIKWADRYHLSDSVLDPTVVQARQHQRDAEERAANEPPIVTSTEVEMDENWDDQLDPSQQPFCIYYLMPLPESEISIVDTKEKLHQCLTRIRKPYTTVGIDAEWKPCMGTEAERAALLQLAVEDHVYLVDLVELAGQLTQEEWAETAEAIFCDESALKIGYGLDTDLRMLMKTFPSMKDPMLRMVRVVDIEKLAKTVIQDYECYMMDTSKFDKKGELVEQLEVKAQTGPPKPRKLYEPVYKTEEKGLSLLVKKTLGKPLSKGEQMSNWEKRPLRSSQITYAAIDAYVLLDVYNALVSRGKALGLTKLDLEPPVTFRTKTRMDKKKDRVASANKSRRKPSKPAVATPHGSLLSPSDLRVVCDTMLRGLGSQLRTCGVDTYIMGEKQRHIDAIQISRRENRVVLTSGKAYDQVRANVGESMCLSVPHDISARDQCLYILQHYNVKVSKNDIFSRCSACNSADFAHISSKDMEKLWVFNLQQKHDDQGISDGAASSHGVGGSGAGVSSCDIDEDTRSKFHKYGIDPGAIRFLHNNVKIQVETVPKQEAFSTIDMFYVCVSCGKVFWEGSHYEKICSQFDNILSMHTDQASLKSYEVIGDDDEDNENGEDNGDSTSEASYSGTWHISWE